MPKKETKEVNEVAPSVETEITATSTVKEKKQERMIAESDVVRLINEALANQANDKKPKSPKRVTEHTAHLWRFGGKWVVDFVDQNTDPYMKAKVHSYNQYNPLKMEMEAWIELRFQDGSSQKIELVKYLTHRVPVYCPILKREKKDISQVQGEVEKKEWVGDRMKGTGKMVEQLIEMYEETFTLKTPEGDELVVPSYALA